MEVDGGGGQKPRTSGLHSAPSLSGVGNFNLAAADTNRHPLINRDVPREMGRASGRCSWVALTFGLDADSWERISGGVLGRISHLFWTGQTMRKASG